MVNQIGGTDIKPWTSPSSILFNLLPAHSYNETPQTEPRSMAPKRAPMLATMTNIDKGKRPMVSKNVEVSKKVAFNRGMFTNL